MKTLTKLNCQYGAPMGRVSRILDIDAGRVYLSRVYLNSGGYDADGAYWGIGAPLWRAMDQDGREYFLRAKSRDTAKDILREEFGADIRFYR
jgi:hypothetical protein